MCVCGKKATKQKNKLKPCFIVGVSNCLKPVECAHVYDVCMTVCVSQFVIAREPKEEEEEEEGVAGDENKKSITTRTI